MNACIISRGQAHWHVVMSVRLELYVSFGLQSVAFWNYIQCCLGYKRRRYEREKGQRGKGAKGHRARGHQGLDIKASDTYAPYV